MTRDGIRTSIDASFFTLSRYSGRGQGEGLPQAPDRAFARRPSPLPLPEYRERGKCVARLVICALLALTVSARVFAHAGPHPHQDDGAATSAGPANFHQLLRTWAFEPGVII